MKETNYSVAEDGTITGYQVGESFRTGATTVYMTVKQLAESAAEPATEIKEFTNSAEVVLSYPKWGADGSGPKMTEKKDDDTAVVAVKSLALPIVQVDKTSNIASNSAAEIGEQHPIRYSLKVTNTVHKPDKDFVDPILLDILPTGVKLLRDDSHDIVLTLGREDGGTPTSSNARSGPGVMTSRHDRSTRRPSPSRLTSPCFPHNASRKT